MERAINACNLLFPSSKKQESRPDAQNTLLERLQQFSHLNQGVLFERLEAVVGHLSGPAKLLVSVLGMVR